MAHTKPARVAGITALLVTLLGLVSIALSQDETQRPDPTKNKILDLVFRVEDMGGRIQDLQVKETGEEIRIDLAADVLFDFDKADLRPAAQHTLHQAAGIIEEKAKGAVRI